MSINAETCECGNCIPDKQIFMVNNRKYCVDCFINEFRNINPPNNDINSSFKCAWCDCLSVWKNRFHIFEVNFCSKICIDNFRVFQLKDADVQQQKRKIEITRYFRSPGNY